MARRRVWQLICDGCGRLQTTPIATSDSIEMARLWAMAERDWKMKVRGRTTSELCSTCRRLDPSPA